MARYEARETEGRSRYWEVFEIDEHGQKFLAQLPDVQAVYAWATERRVDVTLLTFAAWLALVAEVERDEEASQL